MLDCRGWEVRYSAPALWGRRRETWMSRTPLYPHRCAACGPDGGPVRCLDPAQPLRAGAAPAVVLVFLVRGGGHAAASRESRVRLASTPPRYPPMPPSERTTRWQGTTRGSGLVAHAVPTARM